MDNYCLKPQYYVEKINWENLEFCLCNFKNIPVITFEKYTLLCRDEFEILRKKNYMVISGLAFESDTIDGIEVQEIFREVFWLDIRIGDLTSCAEIFKECQVINTLKISNRSSQIDTGNLRVKNLINSSCYPFLEFGDHKSDY